jgi:hypothetical protein
VGLALNNILLFVDLVVVPQVDVFMWRTSAAPLGMCLLLYGLVWDSK